MVWDSGGVHSVYEEHFQKQSTCVQSQRLQGNEEAEKRAAVRKAKGERERMQKEKVKSRIDKIIRKTYGKQKEKAGAKTDENSVVMAVFTRLCYTITNIRKGEISNTCKGKQGMGLCGRHDKGGRS